MSAGQRVAVVGCGRMGAQRARAAHRLGAELVLSDGDEQRSQLLASEFPSASTTPPHRLDWAALDAVFVCTPAGARGPIEMAAAAAGVAVFVEKPIALSADGAHEMAEMIRSSGVTSAVGYMNRYRAGVAKARQTLAGQAIFAVQGHWVGNPYQKDWWTDPRVSGSPFNDQASHLIDLCRYLVGEVEAVSAVERRSADHPEVADVVALALRFAGGACGTLLHSYRAEDKHVALNIFSPVGCTALRGWDFRGDDSGELREADVDGVTPIFLTETEVFLDAVAGRDPSAIRSSFEDGLRSLQVVDAVHRALTSGRCETVG
ncbi:MAG TPA: Gfo/Idh/MocA family oxidoreductase [Gaiellales bacterium]|jgi:predicted dehydrogenase|nr:Gfo/Idh/MocA family oxidoreductase [Gaiellales bacterium]